jgi:SAM-dependent methyltransferase
MKSLIEIEKCPLCGSGKITNLFAQPMEVFIAHRKTNYDLSRLGLTGQELMGYSECTLCSFIFANPTLNNTLEMASYNDAKHDQLSIKEWRKSDDGIALYHTHHKWVDLNPFVIALGFHYPKFKMEYTGGQSRLTLLDIGCGFGHTLDLARVFGVDGIGCDIDESRLSECRAKGLTVLKPDDIDGTFDMVVSSNVIEHVYDLDRYMNTVSNHMRDDGVFVFNGLAKSVLSKEIKTRQYKLLHPIEHRNIFTRKSLNLLLERYGLELASRRRFVSVMTSVRSKAPLYLPYVVMNGFVTVGGVFSAVAVKRQN